MVPAQGQTEVLASFSPREPGIFKGIIKVSQDGFQNYEQEILVNATIVQFDLFLIGEEGEKLGVSFN